MGNLEMSEVEIEDLPRIKRRPRSKTKMAIRRGMWSPILGGASAMVDRTGYAPNQYHAALSNKLGLTRHHYERQASFWGRVANKITWADPCYIDLSGAALMQFHTAAYDTCPDGLEPGETYLLRRDVAEDILEKLEPGEDI